MEERRIFSIQEAKWTSQKNVLMKIAAANRQPTASIAAVIVKQ